MNRRSFLGQIAIVPVAGIAATMGKESPQKKKGGLLIPEIGIDVETGALIVDGSDCINHFPYIEVRTIHFKGNNDHWDGGWEAYRGCYFEHTDGPKNSTIFDKSLRNKVVRFSPYRKVGVA